MIEKIKQKNCERNVGHEGPEEPMSLSLIVWFHVRKVGLKNFDRFQSRPVMPLIFLNPL